MVIKKDYSTPLKSSTKSVDKALRYDDVADEIWNERQVAAYLKVAPKTLRQWRGQNHRLPYLKLGNRLVRYRRTDVEAFVNEHLRRSTSDS